MLMNYENKIIKYIEALMQKIVFLILLLFYMASTAKNKLDIHKELSGFQAGIILGEPTGFNIRYNIKSKDQLDTKFGWWDHKIALHSDYLFYLSSEKSWNFYLGPGVKIQFGKNSKAGLRCAGQVQYWLKNIPVNIFLELAPTMNLDETNLSIHGGLGIRYEF